MGFNDREIVALSGAHALGRCHPDRSGYDGPWVVSPTRFSNQYYKVSLDSKFPVERELTGPLAIQMMLNFKWEPKTWTGPFQYKVSAEGGVSRVELLLTMLRR
jgi:cytochrome c peroxidase